MSQQHPPDTDSVPATSTDESSASTRTTVETAVPEGGTAHICARCGRPFATESYLVLHRGLAHETALTADERESFEEAYATEEAELRRFRIVALGLLVLLYFGFLFAFAAFS